MPELDAHKTDALFREGASRHDFGYEPEAWEQMKALLDAEKAARRRKLGWYMSIGMLLVMLLGVFGYRYWETQDQSAVIITSEQLNSNGSDTPAAEVDQLTNTAQPTATPTGKTNGHKDSLTKTERLTSTNGEPILEETKLAETLTVKEVNTQNRPPETESADTQPTALPSKEALKTAPVEAKADDVRSSTALNQQLNISSAIQVKAVDLLPQKGIPFLVYQPDIPEITISSTDEIELLQKNTPFLSIGISAGTIFGAVAKGGLDVDKPRFGAKVDYHLNNKFSVGTGVYRSQVYYRAAGKDYNAESGFWTYEIEPTSVMAECNILEIPLSLTLHPWGNDRSGFYAATGVTSYLMLLEKFAFEYDSPRTDLIKTWREENTNQHFMGVGHFNLGYQRKTGRRSSFQIETFVNLPLQGIGQGQVQLMTVGASVNYIFGIKK
jgi:hypothetical protein